MSYNSLAALSQKGESTPLGVSWQRPLPDGCVKSSADWSCVWPSAPPSTLPQGRKGALPSISFLTAGRSGWILSGHANTTVTTGRSSSSHDTRGTRSSVAACARRKFRSWSRSTDRFCRVGDRGTTTTMGSDYDEMARGSTHPDADFCLVGSLQRRARLYRVALSVRMRQESLISFAVTTARLGGLTSLAPRRRRRCSSR
jgi:hypothetical protein